MDERWETLSLALSPRSRLQRVSGSGLRPRLLRVLTVSPRQLPLYIGSQMCLDSLVSLTMPPSQVLEIPS